jgi:Tfp pilus assembly protein PilE
MISLSILSVLLFAAIVYCGYRAYYLAGMLAEAQEYIEELEMTNEYMYSRISQSYDVMQEIDRLGAFEAEDEAGTTFQMLKETITELKDVFNDKTEEKK